MARVLVLCGGETLERRVSLDGGDAVARGLAQAGHDVVKLDTAKPATLVGPDQHLLDGPVGLTPPDEIASARLDQTGWKTLIKTITAGSYDLVVPLLHGGWGEGGGIQAVLELLGIPFVGSGSTACALALDKAHTRATAASLDIPLAHAYLPSRHLSGSALHDDLIAALDRVLPDPAWRHPESPSPTPFVLKPNTGGSTVGLTISADRSTLLAGLDSITALGDHPLLEQYIPGREVTVPVLGHSALPMLEIVPLEGFYDYSNKYTKGRTQYLCPAPVDQVVQDRAAEMAVELFQAVGCRHVARVDFRLTASGDLVLLEINTMPGMTALSLVPMGAKQAGLDFPALMDRFVKLALS